MILGVILAGFINTLASLFTQALNQLIINIKLVNKMKKKPSSEVRPARRVAPEASPEEKKRTVGLSDACFVALDRFAPKVGLSKTEFASAAVAYFVENGLNPTADRSHGGAQIERRVAEETREGRLQTAEVGNRLVAIIRTWEKQLYGFMLGQTAAVVNYIEQVESNVLRHQTDVEMHLLAPMLEAVMRGSEEAWMGRTIGERIQYAGDKPSLEQQKETTRTNTRERDEQLVKMMRTYLEAHTIAAPVMTPKPAPMSIPVVQPRPVATPAPAAKAEGK